MQAGFHHEACVYDGADGFVAATAPYVRAGLEAGEAVLVVVDRRKQSWLRDALGADAAEVRFADMAEVGRNPARIIPAWARFVAETHGQGRDCRGIGEPIDATRSPAALRECYLHEGLLDTVFEGGAPWSLLCPYDAALGGEVLAAAQRTHRVYNDGPSHAHRPVDAAAPFTDPLPDPPARAFVRSARFDRASLRRMRQVVRAEAEAAGLGERAADLVLAANELTTNSTLYGGGHGTLRVWHDGGHLVVEVSDAGRIDDPLIGRVEPPTDRLGGRGLWLCNQLCDLVQLRSDRDGTTVRLHVEAPTPSTRRARQVNAASR